MKTGDKVVCVDDGPCKQCGVPVDIVRGSVYVVLRCDYWNRAIPYVALVGAFTGCHGGDAWKNCFHVRRFRLLDELKAEAGLKQQLERKAIEALFKCLREIE
jgi:hypothetical protein